MGLRLGAAVATAVPVFRFTAAAPVFRSGPALGQRRTLLHPGPDRRRRPVPVSAVDLPAARRDPGRRTDGAARLRTAVRRDALRLVPRAARTAAAAPGADRR